MSYWWNTISIRKDALKKTQIIWKDYDSYSYKSFQLAIKQYDLPYDLDIKIIH